MAILPLEPYSIQNNSIQWELLRPFFEITLQDGLARPGKLSIGDASISGFALLKPSSLNLTPDGFQSLSARINGPNGTEIPVDLVFPLTFSALESKIVTFPSQVSRVQMVTCAHPFLYGPMIPGRSSAVWDEVRKMVQTLRENLPPNVPAGVLVPLWDDHDFVDQYLGDWGDWKRLTFALIRFDDGALRNNRHFLKNWQAVLDRLPPDLLRIAWGTISPHFLPLLAYLGFDAVSDFSCVALADKGWAITPYGRNRPGTGAGIPPNNEDLLIQNQTTLQGIHSEICTRTTQGTLRELVELSTHLENAVAAALRNFDATQHETLAPQTRLNKASPLQCTSVESYFRPELQLYRQRVHQRYALPAYKKVVVLLPCSATKPYRESPSHRKVRETIRRAAGSRRFAVEELIMTSPLGLVPRALEDVYPACFYDVPVTGHWDETEVQISTDLLANLLARCPPDLPVVALAEGGYFEVCQQLTKRIPQTIQVLTPSPKLLSASVLADLASFVEGHLQGLSDTSREKFPSEVEEWCRAVADFQFGPGSGAILFPSRLKVKVPRNGRGPTLISDPSTGNLIATKQVSGYFRPHLEGTRRLIDSKIVDFGRIYFAGETIKGSSLFAAGVARVEGIINPGDLVAVLAQETGKLLATAETIVDGQTMSRMRAGAVAKFVEKSGGSGS